MNMGLVRLQTRQEILSLEDIFYIKQGEQKERKNLKMIMAVDTG